MIPCSIVVHDMTIGESIGRKCICYCNLLGVSEKRHSEALIYSLQIPKPVGRPLRPTHHWTPGTNQPFLSLCKFQLPPEAFTLASLHSTLWQPRPQKYSRPHRFWYLLHGAPSFELLCSSWPEYACAAQLSRQWRDVRHRVVCPSGQNSPSLPCKPCQGRPIFYFLSLQPLLFSNVVLFP